jgi:hypothetical protein
MVLDDFANAHNSHSSASLIALISLIPYLHLNGSIESIQPCLDGVRVNYCRRSVLCKQAQTLASNVSYFAGIPGRVLQEHWGEVEPNGLKKFVPEELDHIVDEI